MSTNGITGITLTTDEGSVTVSPEAFHRYAAGVKTMTSATAQRIRVPSEMEFGDEAFISATALEPMLMELVRQHDSLSHIADLTVALLWKKSGGKRGGKPVMGKTAKRSGLVAAFTTADFIVWLAADHVAEADYDERQITALLHHELLHIGWQEPDEDDPEGEGKAVRVGHDFEFFAEEVRTYGAWEAMLQEAAAAFQQAGLFGEG